MKNNKVAGKSRGGSKEEAAAGGGGGGAVRKGSWTEQEDMKLAWFVRLFGERRWDFLAKVSGLNRTGKSCRLRWVNYLHPDLKRGRMSPEEERLVLDLHAKWGNRWSRIAKSMPGRTDNEIKNYWRTHMRKQEKSASAASSPSPTTSRSSSSSSSSSFNNNTCSHDEEDQLLYGTGAMDQLLLWNDDMDTYHLQGGAWSTSTLPLMMPSSPLSWDYCSDSLWGGIADHDEEEYKKMLHAS